MLKKIQLPPDTEFIIQFKNNGSNENWGPGIRFRTIKNANPPAKPSKPTATANLGTLTIRWDGQSADGTAYLPDLARVEVHVDTTTGFTPTTQTMRDQFMHYGSQQETVIGDLEYNTTYYVRLVAYNNSGIASLPSDEAFDTIRRISGIELEDGSINLDAVNLSRRGLRQNLQYNQASPPSATVNPGNPPMWNDTWFDTDDSYKFYGYDHATPFRPQNSNESWEAYFDANAASTDLGWREVPIGTAYQVSGSKVFYQTADPAATAANGDVWYQNTATGVIARVRQAGAWVSLPWGQLADGSITASKIVTGTITANELAANSVTSTKIAANTITASMIQSGQITTDKVGTNQIVAYSANIANGIIDDAKIANVSAGKLSAGIITAQIILSGSIRTSTTGQRVEMISSGIWQYDASNKLVSYMANGSTYIYGDIYAKIFRSIGYQTGGNGFIEIGNTGINDPTDELRMFTAQNVSSIRNPSDRPGAVRISVSNAGTDTFDFASGKLIAPNSFRIENRVNPATYFGIYGGELQLGSSGFGGSYLFFRGTDYNNNAYLANGTNGGGGGGIKFLSSSATVQIRGGNDQYYGDLAANNITAIGNLSVSGSFSPGAINTGNISASTITAYGRGNFNAGMIVQGSIGYDPVPAGGYHPPVQMYVAGNLYASSELVSENNITTRNGSFYSRGSFIGSNPNIKKNITEINVDALELLSDIKLYAWDYDETVTGAGGPGFGMLTSESPHITTPTAAAGEPGDNYSETSYVALLVQAVQQLNAKLESLQAQVVH